MKALVYTGAERLEYRDVPDPVARAGDALVTIGRVGICGSDIHAYLGHDDRRPAPLILGHEAAGVTSDGRRVTINPLVTCGDCAACLSGRDNLCASRQIISMPPREGAFAERVVLPDRNLVAVPHAVTDAQAALAEPIACGWNAAKSALSHTGGADRVLVLGGGAIGLGAALCLTAQGASDAVVVEPNDLRRAYLADHCNAVASAPDGPFDVVVDAVGVDATRATASRVVRPGGAIVHIGLGGGSGGLDLRRMTLQQIAFMGIYTYTAQDFRDTCAAMWEGRLGPLTWVDERPLSDGARAFDDIRAGRVAAPKIILNPSA